MKSTEILEVKRKCSHTFDEPSSPFSTLTSKFITTSQSFLGPPPSLFFSFFRGMRGMKTGSTTRYICPVVLLTSRNGFEPRLLFEKGGYDVLGGSERRVEATSRALASAGSEVVEDRSGSGRRYRVGGDTSFGGVAAVNFASSACSKRNPESAIQALGPARTKLTAE